MKRVLGTYRLRAAQPLLTADRVVTGPLQQSTAAHGSAA
jgi:hypothetical protein